MVSVEDITLSFDKNSLTYSKIKNLHNDEIISLIEIGMRTEEIIKNQTPDEEYSRAIFLLSNKLDMFLESSKRKENPLLAMNTQKGKVAEAVIFKSLTSYLPDAEIEDTSIESGKGDMKIKYLDSTIMIEIKNYSKNVPTIEKNKFHRDLLASSEFDAGIMISCCSGICNTSNISHGIAYKQLGNKFAVYLSNVGFDCLERLVWAILFIVTLQQYCRKLSNSDIDAKKIVTYVSSKLEQIENCVTEITDMQTSLDNHKINMIKTLNHGTSALEISITFIRKRLYNIITDFKLLFTKNIMNDDMSILQLDSAKVLKNRLDNQSLGELKKIAKSMKLKKYSNMNKTDIIEFIKKSRKLIKNDKKTSSAVTRSETNDSEKREVR